MKHRKLLLIGCSLGVVCAILAAALLFWPRRQQPLNDGLLPSVPLPTVPVRLNLLFHRRLRRSIWRDRSGG